MKYVPLTQGKVAIVNNSDFTRLNKYKWSAYFDGWNWYARRNTGPRNQRVMIMMHREILQCINSKEVDHINGDGLDNRRSNLRITTHRQNSRNHFVTSNTGINKRGRKFQARIKINNKALYLGMFSTKKEARNAYDMAANKYFGQFARTKQ